jgi:hypothetical protein
MPQIELWLPSWFCLRENFGLGVAIVRLFIGTNFDPLSVLLTASNAVCAIVLTLPQFDPIYLAISPTESTWRRGAGSNPNTFWE